MKVAKIGMAMHHGFVENKFEDLTIEEQIVKANKFGVEGCFFKSPLYLSDKLDCGKLDYYKQLADSNGLYLDVGFGRINPYTISDDHKMWQLFDGNYMKAVEAVIKAGARIGCTDMVAETAGIRLNREGYYKVDRFRNDVPWEEQLEACARFMNRMKPILKEYNMRICLETHEEITSHEVLRMIEAVGDEYLSICYDTGNVMLRGEEPVAVAKRIAPYVRQMHCKDGRIVNRPLGYERADRPCGDGVVDFKQIFKILSKYHTDIHAHIEDGMTGDFEKLQLDKPGVIHISQLSAVYDPIWVDAHPDLRVDEVLKLLNYAKEFDEKVAKGEVMSQEEYAMIPYSSKRYEYLTGSLKHLLEACIVDD